MRISSAIIECSIYTYIRTFSGMQKNWKQENSIVIEPNIYELTIITTNGVHINIILMTQIYVCRYNFHWHHSPCLPNATYIFMCTRNNNILYIYIWRYFRQFILIFFELRLRKNFHFGHGYCTQSRNTKVKVFYYSRLSTPLYICLYICLSLSLCFLYTLPFCTDCFAVAWYSIAQWPQTQYIYTCIMK